MTVDDAMGPLDLRSLAHTLAAIGAGRDVTLPVQFHPGDVPTAVASPETVSVLHRFEASSGTCAARIPVQRPGGTP